MRTWVARLAGLLRRTARDRDLDDEVGFHLAMLAEDWQRRGLSAEEARAAALRHFGGVTQMKEAYRDQRGIPFVENLVQDARYGVRTLLRTPGFTLAALLTLALGIGANTAIFSVVNAVLLRPLTYPEPDRIVALMRRHPGGDWNGHTGRRYMAFRDTMRTTDAVAAWLSAGGLNLAIDDTAEFVRAMRVSKEFFDVFGVRPAIGQPFTAEHDVTGGPDVVILGDGLWRRYFGSDPGVIGRSILLGERTATVVGVMPAWFSPPSPADLYVPLRPSTTGPGGGFNYRVAARLAPGVTPAQASTDAAAVWQALQREVPTEMMRNELPSGVIPLQTSLSTSVRPALLMMFGAVALLLLIACANTASLLLARASGRGREVAVRAALGAPRVRIIRQLLTESVLLALVGAGLGILLAYWSVPPLLALTPPGFTINQDVRIDGTVLAATLMLAVVTGILFGLAPALSLSRHDLADAFRDDGTRTTAGRRAGWLRRSLVVGEVGLCMLLLVGAALLIQTFIRLRAIDPGFDPHGVLTARMSLQGDRYADMASLNNFFDQGLERLRRIPGVKSAAVVNGVPIEFGLNLNVDILDGPERIDNALTDWRYASLDYFGTMGIPIVAGRGFQDRDRMGAAPVAVVNETFAKRFFKGMPALGRHIRVFDTDGAIEIVGIARDVREQGLKASLPAVMYVPVTQANAAGVRAAHTYFQMSWVVRAADTGPETIRRIREEIRTLDSRQPFSAFRTMEDVKSESMATEKFQMTLLAVFAGIGLMLAAAGIYGLIAFSVAQRTREFGIRIALGSSRGRILRSVIWSGALLAIVGVAVGIGAGLLVTRSLQGFVWGVSTLDPATFTVVAAVLIAVAAIASVVPALRAVRLNPVTALRE